MDTLRVPNSAPVASHSPKKHRRSTRCLADGSVASFELIQEAILDQKKDVFIWGDNQRAPSLYSHLKTVNAVRVSSSGRHYLTLSTTGEVYSWGLGSSGQLGHNDSVNLDTPKKIETFPNGHSQIYSVFCASAQSAAITESGDLYLWGWKGRENVDIPQHISLPAPVIAVGLGGFHVIALVDQEDGPKVFTWGQGAKGQLGYDTQNTQYQPRIVEDLLPFYITQIAAGETHSAALNEMGEMWIWGNNEINLLGPSVTDALVFKPTKLQIENTAVDTLCFGLHWVAALSVTGNLYTWGKNSDGQLGHNDFDNRDTPTLVVGLIDHFVVKVSCSNSHALAATHEGEVFSWGNNNRGRLGHEFLNAGPIPFPKKIENISRGRVVFDIACGATSLAILGIATIGIHFEDKCQRQVVSKGQDVRALKASVCAHWRIDPATVLLKNGKEAGRYLGHSEKLLDIFLNGCNDIYLVPKSEAALADTQEIKFVFSTEDFPFVKAGRVDKLVEWLIHPEYPNVSFMEEFMLTFRSFMEPTHLLDTLIEKYQESLGQLLGGRVKQLKIIDVVRFWIKEYPTDFFKSTESSRKLLSDLHGFISQVIVKTNRIPGIELSRLYALMDPSKEIVYQPVGYPSPCSKVKNTQGVNFYTYPALEIARQLTLICQQIFSKIEVTELLGLAWMKPDKEKRAPHVLGLIRHSNNISLWVSITILGENTVKKKATAFEKFVDIAHQCLILNNFSAFMDILAGLNSIEVYKERKTWEEYPVSVRHEKLLEDWASIKNKAAMRELLANANPPMIPFLGLFLTDLVQIDEGNKDTLDGLIHFKKCSLIAGVVKKIQRCQTTNYKLLPVPELQQYLLSLGGSSAIEAIALQRKSAEAQLTFLNTTSASITDRNKSYNDLRGDRANLWIEWSERIEDPTNTTLYYFADGRSCSFLEILLLSVAVENSIHSAMLEYPKDLELMLFTRLLQLTLHAPNSVDAILEFVQYTQNIRAPAIHRTAMANMISSFKALHPTPRNIKTLPRLSQRNSQVSKKEESDHHDLGAIRSKRKRCNRLAVKISSANEILNNGISKIEVNEQLLNHANMNHVNNYREFVISQIGYLLADVSKFESRLQSVREEQHNQRLLEQQNLASTMENLEALKMELLRVNNLIETISCNLQTEQLKEENFLKNFQLTVDNKESQLRQVYESEQLLNGFLENTMKTSSEIRNEAHCRIVESLQSLETFLSTELAAIKSLGARLDSCKKDIQVMGIRYGPAIAGALEENYRSLKEAFTTNSLHVEYSIESLHSISSDSSMFEFEEKLNHLTAVVLEISGVSSEIFANHFSEL